MRKISSMDTFYIKKILPLIWFSAVCAFILLFVVFPFLKSKEPSFYVPTFVIFLVLGYLGYYLIKISAFDLADEVFDGGTFLLIRKGPQEFRIPLVNIVNVSYLRGGLSRRITLHLKGASENAIAFCPAFSLNAVTLNPVANHPLAEELIKRIAKLKGF